ncbi:MAG: transglutaminase domain-containing protein [Eubacteriales bacterium]|nr:transglutaminase domain-containing protein [Eubacteriales bacterium]
MKRVRNKCLIILFVFSITTALLCACGEKPSEILSRGSEDYGKGKSETTYLIPQNPSAVLTELIESYTASREIPEPMEEEEAQEFIEQAPEEDQLDTSGQNEISSADELQKMLAWMMDETKTTAKYTLTGGYVFDVDSLGVALERASREDPADGICIGSYGFYDSGTDGTIVLNYDLPTSELIQMKKDTRDLVKAAMNDLNVTGQSDPEIIKAVNNYLCDQNTYPSEDKEKYPGNLGGYSSESRTAYALFHDHNAVCEGYARACMLLLNEYGIDCINIWGYAGGAHAWNMVKLDGSWYHVDVCWNDGSWTREDYLLLSDQAMSETRTWDTSEYPASAMNSYTF